MEIKGRIKYDCIVCTEIYAKHSIFQKMYFEMVLETVFSYSSDGLVSIRVSGVILQLLD